MLLYLYTLTFDIFLNETFRVPSVTLGLLLVVAFPDNRKAPVAFGWELLFLCLANLFYYCVGMSETTPMLVNIITLGTCALYFNYFVGNNLFRLNVTVGIVFGWLAVSALIMCADHFYPIPVDLLRGKLMGGVVTQSPSGICNSIFDFGYQVATFATFIFLYPLFAKKSFLIIIPAFLISLILIFYGMQRSALVVFLIAGALATIVHFRANAIPIIMGLVVFGFIFFTVASKFNDEHQANILNKNEQNNDRGEDRSGLVFENLKIYADYPFGLIFYNKNWHEVSKSNPMFEGGLTSHNAYLMFLTYLGPILALIFLTGVYYNIVGHFKTVFNSSNAPGDALLAALCFTLLAVSLNSLFHNAWLINGNGPTVFVYFAILHLGKNKEKIYKYDHSKKEDVAVYRSSGNLVRLKAERI